MDASKAILLQNLALEKKVAYLNNWNHYLYEENLKLKKANEAIKEQAEAKVNLHYQHLLQIAFDKMYKKIFVSPPN
jgi:hypothetical protein